MIGYGPYVASFLLAAICVGWTKEFYLLLSLAIYTNLVLVLHHILWEAYQARREQWVTQG